MRALRRLMLTGLLPLLSGCAVFPQLATSGQFQVEGSRIMYSGPIDSVLVLKLLGAVNEQTTDVLIASRGGSTTAAYQVAELIRQHRLNVTATGPCISACSILFSAGVKKTVLPGAYLGYHWNGRAKQDTVAALLKDGYMSVFEANLEQEVEDTFNTEVGVAQALYDDAWTLAQARAAQRPELRWLERWGGKGMYIWLPTPQELACYGLNVDSFWFPEGGDLKRVPPQYRLGPDLFTTQMLKSVPPDVSTCVIQNK